MYTSSTNICSFLFYGQLIAYPIILIIKDLYCEKQYKKGLYDGYENAMNELKKSTIVYDYIKTEKFRYKIDPYNKETKLLLETSLRALSLPRYKVSIFSEIYILRPTSDQQFYRSELMKQCDSDEYDTSLWDIFTSLLGEQTVCKNSNAIDIIHQYNMLTMY